MTDRDFEFVRGLLIKARNSGESNEGLKEGRIVGNAESIDDAVSELDDKGVYTTVEELSDFINTFISATTFSVSDILGIESAPISAPESPVDQSCWLAYKEMLKSKSGFSDASIKETERYARWIVDRLDVGQAEKHDPRRGLVMGSVQSGKTANMGAVMSMAADRGVNVFIVYSGVLNSLRNQTMGRFAEDLRDSLTSHWHIHDFNKKGADFSDVHCETGSSARNLIVCLKNGTRLTRLGQAMEKAGLYKKSMRILIIDDEADQASPDTEDMTMTEEQELADRSRINKALVKILFNKCTKDLRPSKFPYGAINYLCYTATPYANILNEAGKESLYPADFAVSLPEPANYFGIRAIFGDGDSRPNGLNVVRTIPVEEAGEVASGDFSLSSDTALGRALAWFFCSAATMRKRGYRKPISMLVNPSARIAVHGSIDDSVVRWLRSTKDSIFLDICRRVYETEKKTFTRKDLEEDFPGTYGNISNVQDLFPFESLKDEILGLKSRIERIESDHARKTLVYHSGVHVCVDNSQSRAKSEQFFRIIYPKKEELEKMEKAPVFIVIGGSTLSRGLTLEGLCCSYFPRTVHQADTLMQMGRWFGYRMGYELLQRIWMTYSTQLQFRAMARMDVALKRELNRYRDDSSLRPADYGPRVLQLPDAVHLRLASKQHMQHAVACSYDFAGAGYETTEFSADVAIAEANGKFVADCLAKLPAPEMTLRGSGGYVWRRVDAGRVLKLLEGYSSPEGMTFSRYMKDFIPWVRSANEKGSYRHWNIALCGPAESAVWPEDTGYCVGCIGRTRYEDSASDIVDIGSLRSGIDAIIDVDVSTLNEDQQVTLRKLDYEKKDLFVGRAKVGLGDVPLLLIYVIDGYGNAKSRKAGRIPINLGGNIVGLSVIIPGEARSGKHVDSVQVRTKW